MNFYCQIIELNSIKKIKSETFSGIFYLKHFTKWLVLSHSGRSGSRVPESHKTGSVGFPLSREWHGVC